MQEIEARVDPNLPARDCLFWQWSLRFAANSSRFNWQVTPVTPQPLAVESRLIGRRRSAYEMRLAPLLGFTQTRAA